MRVVPHAFRGGNGVDGGGETRGVGGSLSSRVESAAQERSFLAFLLESVEALVFLAIQIETSSTEAFHACDFASGGTTDVVRLGGGIALSLVSTADFISQALKSESVSSASTLFGSEALSEIVTFVTFISFVFGFIAKKKRSSC